MAFLLGIRRTAPRRVCAGAYVRFAFLITADMIAAIEFDQTGDLLAAGDRGGRVIVFNRTRPQRTRSRSHKGPNVDYRFFHEFQAHEPEFDYLRSVDVEERINVLRWLPSGTENVYHLLSANDKTIKLWRLQRRHAAKITQLNFPRDYLTSHESIVAEDANGRLIMSPKLRNLQDAIAAGIPPLPMVTADQIRIPHVEPADEQASAQVRRLYTGAHVFHINSLSPCADGKTFLSADDLRILMWNLESNETALSVTDTKPELLELLNEIISVAQFHPHDANLYAFGTTRGIVHFCDMRQRALHDAGTIQLPPGGTGNYGDITGGVGGMQFSHDGQRIAIRDYLSVRIFDVRQTARPLNTIPVQSQASRQLRQLYDSDLIYDRFQIRWMADDRTILTGSYSNTFILADCDGQCGMAAEATRAVQHHSRKNRVHSDALPFSGPGIGGINFLQNGNSTPWSETLDYTRKVQFLDTHPHDNIIAVTTLANLFLYGATSVDSRHDS